MAILQAVLCDAVELYHLILTGVRPSYISENSLNFLQNDD